jgi:hypothetical protein
MRSMSAAKDLEIDIENKAKIVDLKKSYLIKINKHPEDDIHNIRLFCKGKELRNEHILSALKLESGIVVQVMVKK